MKEALVKYVLNSIDDGVCLIFYLLLCNSLPKFEWLEVFIVLLLLWVRAQACTGEVFWLRTVSRLIQEGSWVVGLRPSSDPCPLGCSIPRLMARYLAPAELGSERAREEVLGQPASVLP